MPYYQGDPFFGAALGAIGKLVGAGRMIGKVGGAIGRATGIIAKKKPVIGRVLKTAGGAVATGVLFDRGTRLFGGDDDDRKKYRRMNVGNAKALRRSIRRMRGFEKLARTVLTFSRGKTAGRGKFKAKRKSA